MSLASCWRQIRILAEMIKIEHTLFALPFAFMGVILAASGFPDLTTCLWILAAMIGGRSAAMAFNRLADARIDARNPRTLNRALPKGLLRRGEVILFVAASSALFLFAASQLNPLCFLLAWPVLGILFFYSYTKRFTWLSHFVLGFCLGMTPLAGWIAVRGAFDLLPLLLCLGVLFWTAGFDVIYACQDFAPDRREGLFSIPARFGIAAALKIAWALHGVTLLFFVLAGIEGALGAPYWIGLALSAVFLAYEHAIVKPADLSRVNVAFFTANGFVSMAMCLGTYLAVKLA